MPSEITSFISRHPAPQKSGSRFIWNVAKMKDVISLGIGEPDLHHAMAHPRSRDLSLEKGKTHYTSNLGLIELRGPSAAMFAQHYGLVTSRRTRLITVGVSEAWTCAARVDRSRDKVMYHNLANVSYHPSVTLTHALRCRCQPTRRTILR